MWKFLACLTVFILVTEHCKLHPLGISEYDTKNWTWSFHNAPDVHITERIVRVCLYMRKISRRAYEPVTFQITLDDRPKRMDANGVPTRELINSGYQDGGTIVVYRREEVDKVCLHELVHLFRMDARPSGDAIRAALGLHVAGVHEPTEAIAETVAQLVLCHYIAETYGRDLQELYKTENEFGRRQAAKVLRWMKIDDIFTSEIRQDTYAIEYYVLRAILFDFALRRGTHVLLSHTFLQGAEEVSDEVVVAFCIEAWSPANVSAFMKGIRDIEDTNDSLRMNAFELR